MKRKLSLITPIDDPCRVVVKRFKEKRTKILKQSLKKLKQIPDAEQCLRQAVLIRNTFIRAKDLSPKTFERQLPTLNPDILDRDNSDLLVDFQDDQMNNSECTRTSEDRGSESGGLSHTVIEQSHNYRLQEVAEQDKASQSYQSDCGSVSANDLKIDSRQLVAVS